MDGVFGVDMDKVLIVEDDLKFQRILRTRLQKYKDKFEIVLANNGAEAIKVLQQKFHLRGGNRY